MAAIESRRPASGPRAHLEGWPLFGLLAALLVTIELWLVRLIDWSSPDDIRWLMGIHWRLAAPYFLLTFAASPLYRLFPGPTTRWLASNRRYLGLAFAVGASFQLAPIATLALRFPPALAAVHSESSQYGEDLIFLTLTLMTVTSFRFGSRHLSGKAWRRLHASGMYLLAGLYAVSYVYFALHATDLTYVVLALAFVLAWGLRAGAWWRRREEFRDRKFFWALFGLTNGLMLASWSYFGIERDASLRLVLAVATVLACALFLAAVAAGPLARLRPGPATARLVTERDRFFVAFAIAIGWYVALALAGRLTAHVPAVSTPLPLAVAIAIGTVAAGTLALRARDRAAGRNAFASLRPIAHALVAALLVVGLLLGRPGA
jgi:hypothetical protein